MKLDEIREALRTLSPADLQAVLAEFAAALSDEKAAETERPVAASQDVAAAVIADRQELLRRLAQR